MDSLQVKIINGQTLDDLSAVAQESDRKRKNLNLHEQYDDPCQRLFNALEIQTYIRPHRHTDPPKPECFMGVRGRMALVLFDDEGEVTEVVPFGAGSDAVAIEVPPGTWHSILSLESGSVFFETKPGPYVPLTDKDFAPWSPEEGASEAASYLITLRRRVMSSLPQFSGVL